MTTRLKALPAVLLLVATGWAGAVAVDGSAEATNRIAAPAIESRAAAGVPVRSAPAVQRPGADLDDAAGAPFGKSNGFTLALALIAAVGFILARRRADD